MHKPEQGWGLGASLPPPSELPSTAHSLPPFSKLPNSSGNEFSLTSLWVLSHPSNGGREEQRREWVGAPCY